MESKKIYGLGEIMLRLNPPNHQTLSQAQYLEMNFGGAEANTLVSLSQFGHASSFLSRIPDNSLGNAAVQKLQSFGVSTSLVEQEGKRLGMYFLEQGASMRASKVLYDRQFSAISEPAALSYEWEDVLDNASWFHFTGITPALSENCKVQCANAVEAANKMGVPVSFDFNFRQSLWSKEQALECFGSYKGQIELLIANKGVALELFGIGDLQGLQDGAMDFDLAKEAAIELFEIMKPRYLALTLRQTKSASQNQWAGLLYDGQSFYISRIHDLDIVDRIGAGDAFAAGLIHSFINSKGLQYAIDFAAAAGAMKHTYVGDFNLATQDEIENVIRSNDAGYVKR